MSKWLVLYSSVTGNTKKLAEAIAEAAGADVFPVQKMPADLSAYEVVALGYWLRLGGPDPLMMKVLPQIRNKEVILFETHGTTPNSEHAVTAYARAAYLLGEGCMILGTFGSQGQINPRLLEKRKNAPPDDPHGGAKSMERWAAAKGHPDAEDLERAQAFVQAMEKKREQRRRFLARKAARP